MKYKLTFFLVRTSDRFDIKRVECEAYDIKNAFDLINSYLPEFTVTKVKIKLK